jgi:MOSC domain-containing protein YiiM
VKEVPLPSTAPAGEPPETTAFRACVATILELPLERIPRPRPGEDPATGWSISRWLGEFGLGLAPLAEPATFSWPGPWIARLRPDADGRRRPVVMFGVPSGVVWDPAGVTAPDDALEIGAGYLIAAADIALALPPRPAAPSRPGRIETINLAASAGAPATAVQAARALPGRGLEGDRHVTGQGTFPSGPPGSALTLIEAEVCESFAPPLEPGVHRRNLVTRGIALNDLVGREFTIGAVRCRGMRLCEPCTVLQGYAGRPVLRALVHRGGLRADILEEGEIRVGDALTPVR